MASSPSYVHGASGQPLIGERIGRYFDAVCARGRGRDALVVRPQGVRLTYAELRKRVDALACGLRRLGLAPGDRVGIRSNQHPIHLGNDRPPQRRHAFTALLDPLRNRSPRSERARV